MAINHKNITISVPIVLANEINEMREEFQHGQSEMYLYLVREGLREERKRRQILEFIKDY